MSEASNPRETPAGELQFDRAEYAATPAATCKFCGRGLHETYYEINGQALCPSCRDELQRALSGGSAFGRLARATVFGLLAGLAGAVIYYGVTETTHINFGLISVLVGLMVGKAVKKGSGGRGGWFYQALAMLLTYCAIVLTFVPPLIAAMRAARVEEKAAIEEGLDAQAALPADGDQPAKLDEPEEPVAAPGDAARQPRLAFAEGLPAVVQFVLALGMLVGLAFALPVWGNLHNPMGLLIIGIGLYEAWVINRRVPMTINGPFRIAGAGGGSAAHVEPSG